MSLLISSTIAIAISLAFAFPLTKYNCEAIREKAVLKNVDFSRYLGHWYELYHSRDFYFDQDCKCTEASYSLNSDSSIRVDNKCIRNNRTVENIGKGFIVGNASLSVEFTVPFKAPYDIVYISDDYSYAGVMSCSNFPIFGGLNLWILGRSPYAQLEVEDIEDVLIRFRQVGLGDYINELVQTNQTDCSQKITYDELEKNQPFYSTNVSNFNLTKYLGKYNVIAEIPDINNEDYSCNCITISLNSDMTITKICISNGTYYSTSNLELISNKLNSEGKFLISSVYPKNIYQILDITDDYEYSLIIFEFKLYMISKYDYIPPNIIQRFIQVVKNLDIYSTQYIHYIQSFC